MWRVCQNVAPGIWYRQYLEGSTVESLLSRQLGTRRKSLYLGKPRLYFQAFVVRNSSDVHTYIGGSLFPSLDLNK